MPDIFGRGVTAVCQVQSAFDAFPSGGTWIPLSAYERSDGETRPREVDPLLGVAGQHNNRDAIASAPALTQGGGQIQVPICLREIGYWLTATFGAPVTTVDDGVYTHAWESGKDVLAYLAQSKKIADGWYERTRGLCVNTLALNFAKEAGYPRMTLGTMLRDAAKAETEASGTIAEAFELLRPTAARPFVERDDLATPTTALTFNYSNQLERYDPLKPEGEESEYPDGYDPGDTQVTGSFTVRLQDATFDDLADADAAEPWKFGWRVVNGLGEGKHAILRFTVHNVKIDRAPKSVNTPGRLTQTYNFQGEQGSDTPAVTVELINDVPGYPPPSAPAAFGDAAWSVAPGDEKAVVTITTLPANGGAAITDIEYRVDEGSWVSSGGIVGFEIAGLSNSTEYDIAIRAKNSVGSGAASSVKTVTPTDV